MAIRDATRDTVESSSSSCASEVHKPCEAGKPAKALVAAAKELEKLRRFPETHDGVQFPPACHSLLLSLPGNQFCADCEAPRPEWASISYGIMLCVQCCGRHRSFGVAHSRVRSIEMDSWKHSQVLTMLEGGNDQLRGFFKRHRMDQSSMTSRRYKTKAALFYRTHLQKHIDTVVDGGMYEGREATRRRSAKSTSTASHTHTKSLERSSVQSQEIAAN